MGNGLSRQIIFIQKLTLLFSTRVCRTQTPLSAQFQLDFEVKLKPKNPTIKKI